MFDAGIYGFWDWDGRKDEKIFSAGFLGSKLLMDRGILHDTYR